MATDRELLERHMAGDRLALAQLVELHEGPLLRFARALTGSEDQAQDAVQEAFLRLLREGPRLREIRALSSWLFEVTRNLCYDRQRKELRMDRKHEDARREHAGAAVAAADAPVLADEAHAQVREAISRLPEVQREVVRLKLWEGLSYREIGARMGMTLTNVSYHLGQAVRALAGELRSVGIPNRT